MVQRESRVKKTLLNARVNLIFYFLTLCLSFFSRKIFLDCLGADFVGLTGTLQNLLGYLNLAELGVGAAIAFNLYKPIQQGDRTEINNLISLFGYYYRNIGLTVLGAGVILSAFIPLIFRNSSFPFGVIYFAFYAFLTSSLIGYFINYRATLLTADQRNYVVSAYIQTGNILKTIIQLFTAYYYTNYYAWIAIDLTFGILCCIILNLKINKVYPWLKCSAKFGKLQASRYPNILNSTKQIFIHKIKDFILTQSDQLFIFVFVSLKMVAYYGNYVIIISKLTTFFNTIIGSVDASVGNLVAERNCKKMITVFWELMTLRYFISGIVCFSIYHLASPFITLWLGSEYILNSVVLYLLLINLFISISRGTVDNFNFAFGHYADIWSAWAEGIINISGTLVCGYYWGISGILLGKTMSIVPIIVFWKPYYLFRDGFHLRYSFYWSKTIAYYILFFVSAFIVHCLIPYITINPYISFGQWLLYAIVCCGTFITIYATALTLYAPGGKTLLYRLPLKRIGIHI
jgi:O-antigen/teichoic acid export membrane protein